MKSGDPLVAARQPLPVEDLAEAVARNEGELKKKNHDAYVPRQDSRIEQAETRTDEANTRTEEANTRTEEANTRTEEANTRTDEAEARSAQAILASERRYRRLFETAQDGILILDADTGQVVDANPFMKDLLGYSQEEFLGRKLWEIGPFKGSAASKIAFAELQLKDRIRYEALPLETKDGRRVEVEFISNAYLVDKKRLIQCNIRDITKRKEGEDRLREQAKLLDLAQDAIMVRDMEDRVEFWNHGAEKLYGWTAAEVQAKRASSFLYEDGPVATAAARVAVIENGKWTGECTHSCKDGGTVMVRSRWTLVRDELAAPKSILIINTDITEQRKLETHLLRAQRLESIGTLASGVAHDLNNILSPILMCAEVLKGNPMREDVPALVSMIEESAKRGANVVKQVFTFARGIEGERVMIKPSHLIQEMIDIAQQTFPKSIEMSSRYPEDLWSINCDPTQLHQVLLNLSLNARDAMPNGGSLTIGAENFEVDEHYASMTLDAKPGAHVVFCVTDTGAGMSRTTINKIFDPFFTTKEVGKGTGLGLSTALGIVKSHGGFISVYSEIGMGTTFKVFLPAKLSEESSPKLEMPPELLEGNGEVVLVIDDEPGVVQMTKMILEKRSYRVLTAEDGPAALAVIAQQGEPTKVVLTDMSMPFMDSVVLIRAIQKMKPATVFIASTGHGEQTRMSELESLGVRNFLSKPYDTQTLLTTVRDTLNGAPRNPVHLG